MIHLILLAFFIAVIASWFSEPTVVTVRVVVQGPVDIRPRGRAAIELAQRQAAQ